MIAKQNEWKKTIQIQYHKTLEQQIEILREKGLVINDVENAKKILFKENYFFITCYRHLFMTQSREKKFNNGTTFDELYAVFIYKP